MGGLAPHRGARIAAPLILVLVWAALCALTDPVGNFPLNDDWTFAPAVRSILETGRFAVPARTGANLIAQAYWGALFCLPSGFSYTALRISTFVLSGAGLLGLYGLGRELGAPRRVALVAALGMAANPFYLSLSASFMTDALFTALVALSLWLYARGVSRAAASALAP